jgi:hypothetical protein
MRPLQSSNALSAERYEINDSVFGNPHTYADRGVYPQYKATYEARYGDIATDRTIHVMAGRATMKAIEDTGGPRPPYIVGPTIVTGAGNLALGLTRQLLPGIAEAEIAFATGSMYAYAAGHTLLGSALASGAAYTPLVGGSMVAGAIVGNVAEGMVTNVTRSGTAGLAAGVLAAGGAGAVIGAAIGSVIPVAGTAIGAGTGAVVGGLVGLSAYVASKYW